MSTSITSPIYAQLLGSANRYLAATFTTTPTLGTLSVGVPISVNNLNYIGIPTPTVTYTLTVGGVTQTWPYTPVSGDVSSTVSLIITLSSCGHTTSFGPLIGTIPALTSSWIPTASMNVAMNAGGDLLYAARRLANLVQSMGAWAPVTITGSARTTTYVPYANYTGAAGTWSQWQGTLYGDGDGTGTDAKYFRAVVASSNYGLPSTSNGGDGLYIVLNPCGLDLAIGTAGQQALSGGFRSDKYFTFTYPGNNGAGIDLWFRKATFSNTGAGNVQIIPHAWIGNGTIDTVNGVISSPGTTGYTSGNPWNPDFIAAYQALNCHHIRWMAATNVNGGVERNLTDRVTPASMTFLCAFASPPSQINGGFCMPYEYMLDFSNRTNIHPWINIPHQATSAYITGVANIFNGLNAGLQLVVEYVNETWNYAAAFGVGTAWTAYMQYTKHTSTPSDTSVPGAPVFLATAHGRSVGDSLQLFSTQENNVAGMPYYVQGNSSYTISAVPDANHFTLDFTAAGHSCPSNLPNIMWAWQNEPGCASTLVQANINHGLQQLAIWDTFDSVMGSSRIVHSMGSQAADASHTSGRVGASAGTIARTELVHVAPYYSGLYWGIQSKGGGGSITPHIFTSTSGTVWWGVYASGSTPTKIDIVNQTGAGFIGGGGATGTSVAWSQSIPQPSLPTVSGLTDGTNYAVFFILKEAATGYFWKIGTGTDAQNPTNVLSTNGSISYIYDTYANQSIRARANGISTANYTAQAAAISSVGSTAKLLTYECGADMALASGIGDALCGSMVTWLVGFLGDAANVAAMQNNYYNMARVGFKNHTYYMDNQGSASGNAVYDFIKDAWFANHSDGRFAMVAAFNGSVPQYAPISSSVYAPITTAAITSAPSYPYTVATLTAGYTYTLMTGDWTDNFSISGLNLVMNNGTGVDYSQYAPRTLTIEVADAYSSQFFPVTIPLGTAWWPVDSQYVWDSVGASAGTSMTPPGVVPFSSFGSPLTQVTGTGNPVITSSSGTVTNDVWKMATYVYGNNSALTQNISTTLPFLIAHIVDIGDQTTTFQYQLGVGSASNSISWGVGTSNTNSRWRVILNGSTVISGLLDGASNPSKGTKVVHWMYCDPIAGTAIGGQNQTDYTAGALSGLSLGNYSVGGDVRIGTANAGTSSQSQMYHGSVIVLSRSGMTKADAKAIVQSMQTHHGI